MINNEIHLDFTRALIRNVLEDSNREWTIQGFGFLRTYFGPADKPKMYRLNLWDGRFAVPNVSTGAKVRRRCTKTPKATSVTRCVA